MRFQTIKITDSEGFLLRFDKQPDGSTLKQELAHPSRPLPEFVTAVQAFSGFAVDLIGAKKWHEEIKVSSLHLSEEPKTNRRGLIVTFTRKIERAKNRVVVVNTPLMHAPVEDEEGTSPGTFPRLVADLIEAAEAQATRYWNGEREQVEIFDQKSETETLRKLLLDAGRDVPAESIDGWTQKERNAATKWAAATVRSAAGGQTKESVPAEPKVLLEHATPALV